ncbi:2,3-bisphosphoglycerate-independent phosphoglycerate mutase [Fervidicoccus fontis]|uniref:Phosphoglycerate mutase n=2 Tax=Fervidicoccus fontis TaxID=683846 RepID=I0A2B2_FERFK|nr:2,3-bisphosphoglycerate-independent phosphoglycerate mutase [Fervidicoccus fontis]AFH43119.1 phosphoglycerate mutase [Fervidicoccus fontis Kam940]MBE9390498.1 2,3-bisphosphoglycerate-independent phosphoglycerate mutase [Fervidicoccus fontis]
MKLVYLVLDGAAGDPNLGKTAYMIADKPNLDSLAYKSKCGLMYVIGKGIAPESDAAVLALLGYDPINEHPGRGPIEALGVDIELKEEKEVAFRGNFATVDPLTKKIIDRRAGRGINKEEANELASLIDGIQLLNGKGYAKVKATVGHRVVVVLGHKEKQLGDEVSNTDPAYERRGKVSVALENFDATIKPCIPLNQDEKNRITCELVNEFTERAIKILSSSKVNESRLKNGMLPANAILLRDAGTGKAKMKDISAMYSNLKFSALTEMPVEKGIAKAAGMKMIDVSSISGERKHVYEQWALKTIEALSVSDVVYVHLKGPDEPGHEGNLKLKTKIIEDIDKYYLGSIVKYLEKEDIAILVTSDHATPCEKKAHSDSPVPFLLYSKNFSDGDRIKRFDEVECKSGSFGLISEGKNLLKTVLSFLKML